ncbi:hypothetical protein BYT27DRAFT_7248993 [Phlegmacium glaucopus]|nr:hypothetical protein BYT27DRAFT_7248993 [Phlegmacium glaucopus]
MSAPRSTHLEHHLMLLTTSCPQDKALCAIQELESRAVQRSSLGGAKDTLVRTDKEIYEKGHHDRHPKLKISASEDVDGDIDVVTQAQDLRRVSQLCPCMTTCADVLPILRKFLNFLAAWRSAIQKMHEWETELWGGLLDGGKRMIKDRIPNTSCHTTYLRTRSDAGHSGHARCWHNTRLLPSRVYCRHDPRSRKRHHRKYNAEFRPHYAFQSSRVRGRTLKLMALKHYVVVRQPLWASHIDLGDFAPATYSAGVEGSAWAAPKHPFSSSSQGWVHELTAPVDSATGRAKVTDINDEEET